jgi:hypothetical protein
MKVRITRTSDPKNPKVKGAYEQRIKWGHSVDRYWFIEVETVQDILDLAKKYKASIIVNPFGPELEIYDTYRE